MHGRARRFGGVIVGGLLAACWGVSAYGQGGNFDGFGNLIEASPPACPKHRRLLSGLLEIPRTD